jgi:hypothetical protein
MQECNSPRNSRLKTHSDETLGSAIGPSVKILEHRNRFSDALINSYACALDPSLAR